MKTPKDRARDKRRSPNIQTERERRRAHLAAGGTIANYDTSHYAMHAPEGWHDLTPETMDEIDKAAEKAHLDMKADTGTVNVLDSSTYGNAPF
jgi:hypothetical protein